MLMTFSQWKQWFLELPWVLRWFIVIILLRPLIDAFYFLKDISVFLSPLYLVGVATPILAIYTIYTHRKPNYSRLDTFFAIYTFLLALPCLALLISDSFGIDSIDNILKVSLPSFLYFFSRCLIRSKRDLDGLLQTFLYSSVVVLFIFSYELIFNPISVQISRGFERFQGTYADTMNYSIYMTGALLISGYQLLQKNNPFTFNKRLLLTVFIVVVSVLLLFNIHHTASYIVASAIVAILILHSLKSNAVLGISILMVTGSVLFVAGGDTFNEKLLPLIESDIMVYEGEKGDEALFHGRVGRWKNFYDYFSSNNTISQLFGLPLNMESPFMYIGKGSHNDFVRTNMLMGYSGLIVYLFILSVILRRILRFPTAFHFLGLATLTTLILFSITTTPLLYPTLMYIVMPVIATLALPPQIMEDRVL